MTARVVAIGVLAAWTLLGPARAAEAQRAPGWELRVPERVDLTVGGTGTLALALAVDRGLSVSRDAPVIVDLGATKGVTVRRRRLGREDAVDPEADAPRFAIAVRGDVPGEHVAEVRVRFWVCSTRLCRPIDVRRTTTFAVSAPPTAEAPTPDAGAR